MEEKTEIEAIKALQRRDECWIRVRPGERWMRVTVDRGYEYGWLLVSGAAGWTGAQSWIAKDVRATKP